MNYSGPSISFNVAYSGFKHDIVAKVNNKDMQRWDNLSSLPASLAFNSTADNRMYSELSNSTSGTMRVYLNTRNSSGDLIGQDYKDITISVSSSIVPSIDSVSISEAVSGLATQFGGYVQNKSKLSIGMSASGNKYSTIRSYKITANGRSYSSSSATTEILKSSGSNRITFEVTDSRGRKMSTHRDIIVIAYDNPQIYDLSAERSDSAGTLDDQGNYARVNYHAAISSVNSNNTKSFKLSYRLSGASTWIDVTLPNINYSYDTYKVIGPLDVDFSYDIQLVVSDYFSDVPADISVSSTFTLINFARDKKGLAFGKTYDENNGGRLQVDGDSTFDGAVKINKSANSLQLRSNDPNGHAYMSWWGSGGDRRGYFGIESTNYNTLTIKNEAGEYVNIKANDLLINDDPVVEYGSNSNGEYAKFYSGLQIAWGIIDGGYPSDRSTGSLYRSYPIRTNLPVYFPATPVYSGYARRTTNDEGNRWVIFGYRPYSTATPNMFLYSAYSSTATGYDIYWSAIGRWK